MIKPVIRCVIVMVLASVGLAPSVTSYAADTPIPPAKLAVFNTPVSSGVDPGPGGEQPTPGGPSKITETIVASIMASARGAKIAIAQAVIGDLGPGSEMNRVLVALRYAVCVQDADVHIVLHDGETLPEVIDALENVPTTCAGSPPLPIGSVTVDSCLHGCYSSGTDGIQHNKFLLINDTVWLPTVEESLVLQMTANWNDEQLRYHFFNSALMIWGDAALYSGYRGYFNGMIACHHNASGCPTSRTPDPEDVNETSSGIQLTSFRVQPALAIPCSARSTRWCAT